jgi:hypothetical protein
MATGTGFSNAFEATLLDDLFRTPGTASLRSLYLYLFTGSVGDGLADDGSRNGGTTSVNLCTGGGFTPKTLANSDFASAVAGAPSTRSLSTSQSWTAVGSAFGSLCWWAISTVSGATIVDNASWDSNKSSMIAHGPITTSGGSATAVTVNTGETFTMDSTNPIKFQLGDPGDTFA